MAIVKSVSVTRLFNLGSYEHRKLEMHVEIQPGENPILAIVNAQQVLENIGSREGDQIEQNIKAGEETLTEILKLLEDCDGENKVADMINAGRTIPWSVIDTDGDTLNAKRATVELELANFNVELQTLKAKQEEAYNFFNSQGGAESYGDTGNAIA